MTQQLNKFPGTNLEASPAREIVENPVSAKCVRANSITIGKPEAGTLQFAKKRFAKYGTCTCSEQFIAKIRPYNTDYTEKQCQVCQKTFGRVYD